MKCLIRFIGALVPICLLLVSCATDPLTRTLDPDTFQNLTLQVSGTAGSVCVCNYEFSPHKGNFTAAVNTAPKELLQLPAHPGQAEIVKTKPADQLLVEIFQGATLVLQANVPPGKVGVRIVKSSVGWTADVY
jgi:hypothetical protein